MGKELRFDHLDRYVTGELSDRPGRNRWMKLPYTADGTDGTMLAVGELDAPDPIEVDLGVKGVYKIFICLGMISGNSCVEVSLSGEEGKTLIMPSHLEAVNGYARWSVCEYAEEAYFKTADLTDGKLIFNKPRKFYKQVGGNTATCSVLYIRLEEVAPEELEREKAHGRHPVMQYHLDCDYFIDCDYEKTGDYLGRLKMLDNGNIDSVIHENPITAVQDYDENACYYHAYRVGMIQAIKCASKMADGLFRGFSDFVHDRGAEIYYGFRMGAGDLSFPFYYWEKEKALQGKKEYRDFHCVLRNGKQADFLSYAYPEVRKLVIDRILFDLPASYDGVSLFFHRGTCALFEQPVAEKVKADYGVEAKKLPFSDERLHNVLCFFVTDFMRELKEALRKKAEQNGKDRYKINAIVYYDLQSSKNFGMDVETWAREGLVDSVSQGLMTYYEDLDGVLDENGLIDAEKYAEKEKTRVVVKRIYDDNADRLVGGTVSMLDVCRKYGVKYYGSMLWEHGSSDGQVQIAKRQYQSGADNLLLWNTNHLVKKLPALEAVKQCGDKEKVFADGVKVYRRVVRITRIADTDISEFCVNWKG